MRILFYFGRIYLHGLHQVRSYCRGLAVRSVDATIRESLVLRLNTDDMEDLRSFLDPPKAKGYTVQGSGDAAFRLHKRNHTTHRLVAPGALHDMVYCSNHVTFLPLCASTKSILHVNYTIMLEHVSPFFFIC